MNELRDASQYPVYCPNCGQRRQLQRVRKTNEPANKQELANKPAPQYVMFIGKPRLNSKPNFGLPLPVCQAVAQESITETITWEAIPECLRCGFEWKSIPDPTNALARKLIELRDNDLCMVIKLFYPNFHNLISVVAAKVGKSIGHVQRVLDGERKSQEIDHELVNEFRKRLVVTGTEKLL